MSDSQCIDSPTIACVYLFIRAGKIHCNRFLSIKFALDAAFEDIKTNRAQPKGILDENLGELYNAREIMRCYYDERR